MTPRERLDQLGAVVFVHPSYCQNGVLNEFCAQPAIDYPHETCRAAVDLVLRGKKRRFSNIRFILCHGGGTLPSIAFRVAGGASQAGCPLSSDEIRSGRPEELLL